MRQLLISEETYSKLRKELDELKSEMPTVRERIAEARSQGDLSENAEYHAARERLAFIEARIAQLGSKISNATIVDKKKIKTNAVNYGTTVKLYNKTLKNYDEVTVVGDGEADPDKDEISINSPIGKAILGKKIDDEVEAILPTGTMIFKIKKIFKK